MYFTGKERDAESGLDYFGARYMSSAQGRFTSPDRPFADQHATDPQSWNMYAYVRNNPLKNVDPDGAACLDGQGAASCANYIAGGVGAVGNAFTSGIVNFPNRFADAFIGLFNGGRRVFGDVVLDAFTPANSSQQQGVDAANAMMLISPLAEVGATALVEAVGTGAKVESATTRIAPKIGESGGPGAGKPFPNGVKGAARAESNDTCVFCGQPTTRAAGENQSNIDHAIPKSRDGNNTLNNAQNTCRTCNLNKATKTTQEYQQELRRRQEQQQD